MSTERNAVQISVTRILGIAFFSVIYYHQEMYVSHLFEAFWLFQSPKKVNLVAKLVRGMRVEDALLQLQVTVKRAAKTVYQVLACRIFDHSTVSNDSAKMTKDICHHHFILQITAGDPFCSRQCSS